VVKRFGRFKSGAHVSVAMASSPEAADTVFERLVPEDMNLR
jgi:hypothetical protein